MNVEVNPPEKKKKMKNTAKSPSFSLLPDEITVNFLARIPRSYYPKLSIVSKTFRSLLSSTELYSTRCHLGNTEECLYVCLWDRSRYEFPQWYTLWINPNRIKKKKTISQFLVPIPSSNFRSTANPIVVGSEIYVIGGPLGNYSEPSSAVRVLDCRTHTWRDARSMNVAREHAATCVFNGKIYVIGGVKVKESPFGEVFDTKTQTWECLPDPSGEVRKNEIYRIAEMEGKINFGNSSKMYAYDTKKGEWECCGNIVATYARSACVIENESYYFGEPEHIFSYTFEWSDVNGGHRKEVKGVDLLGDMYMRNGGSSNNTTKRACCGGKFYVMWEGNVRGNRDHKKKIWCAEISVEKRDGCEIWGNMEWVDVVHTVPKSCKLMHFLAASV